MKFLRRENKEAQPASSESDDPGRLNNRKGVDEFDARLKFLAILFVIPMLFLAARLYTLQVAHGEEFYELSDRNFIRSVELTPDRGRIFDANERVLAENRPVYDIYVTPEIARLRLQRIVNERADESQDPTTIPPDLIRLLSELMHLSQQETVELRERVADTTRRADILVDRNISREELARVETRREDLPGVFVRVSQHRHYPYGELTAHVVGYMNEVSGPELEELRRFGYHRGDYIGRAGIERSFEEVLRGAPGLRRQVIDVNGNAQNLEVAQQLLGAYREMPPVPGKNLHLTIDMELQEIIDEVVSGEHSVAVAAVDPRDGSILGLYSRPSFNPNAWSGRLSAQEKQEIDENPYHPLLDKAIYAWAPGSTYKIVGAIAALEEGIFDPESQIRCRGSIEYGGRVFRCWKRSGHGWMNLEQAIEQSCDVYFYELGIRLGMDTLADYAYQLGFGQRSGLGLPGERAGLIPTREWHEQNTTGGFVGGFTLGAVIGQDVVQVSPVQLALSYAALANGGTLYYPRLIDRITTAEDRVVFEYPARVRNELPFSEATMDLVTHGLEMVMETGSGSAQHLEYVNSGGKTGTAQVAALDSLRIGEDGILWKYRDHAWFAAYAPAEEARIAVVVLVEHGGAGSTVAAPLAMRIIDRYFREVMGWDDEIQQATSGDAQNLQRVLAQPQAIDVGGREALELNITDILSLGSDGIEEVVQ